MPDDPQAQPAEGQDQPVAPPPAVAAPPVSDGPWASDLNLIFQDEAERQRVDQFLRQKVQPYTTKLEQEKASYADAVALWTDLSENPLDTFVGITTQMFGEEAGNEVLQAVQRTMNGQQQTDANQTAAVQAVAASDPRLEAMLQWVEQQQATQSYESEMARIKADPANADVDPDLLHPFVAAANGDFNQALGLYRQFSQNYAAKQFATLSPEQQALLNQKPAAPPVMGSDSGAAPSTTPTAPVKQTLDQAIGDFMAENRAARQAPPVGAL